MGRSVEITSLKHFQETVASTPLCVVVFWTKWHGPSKETCAFIDILASPGTPGVCFMKVEAETVPEVTKLFSQVRAVPTTLFVKGPTRSVVASVDGHHPPKIQAAFDRLTKAQGGAKVEEEAKEKGTAEALNERLAKLVAAAPMMLFMKGSPEKPFCKFSRFTVEFLAKQGVQNYGHFDILTDETVRQGLKTFSNWPTYPQLYINGKLVGGLDVMKELAEEGEFAGMVPQVCKDKEATEEEKTKALNERLAKLVAASPMVLFMKGSPEKPFCRFSRAAVEFLAKQGIKNYGHFDILTNEAVRQGLKTFSNWPTYPQLYINGKLVGGLDVMKELAEEGEFAGMVPQVCKE